ncbi:hypothetical protein PV518_44735 [Streptomyces sp. ND04-05B]|uniref:hypothetical protein n=1 Tax=Streptomyces sp. ND04-05B TaxID=3028693 RepID=UPI0029A3CBEF|nr:hypothetical protein [Streptomyces sp. ND04-05B]MDX3069167.1 hypothetical protein [Streptomyces sp. ND04-05B]
MADELAEETQKVIEALKGIEEIEDPVARAAAISEVLKYVEKREPKWRELRRAVVLNLRAENVSYRRIASMIKVSLGTVQSIERGHAGAWRTKARTKPKPDGQEGSGNGGDEQAGGSASDANT